MTAPGWYNAEGDPAGSQRYWDGAQWVGDPVYEPAGSVAAGSPPGPVEGGYSYVGQQPGQQAFPRGLKTLAIIVSVLKFIPLVLGLIGAIWLATAADEVDDSFDEIGIGLGDLVGAAIVILIVIIVIGGILLGFHFWGALKERPVMLFIPALIMALLDIFSTLSAWNSYNDPFSDTNAGGAALITVTMIAQVIIAIWAIKVFNNRSSQRSKR